MKVLGSSRALSARSDGDEVTVTLANGHEVVGSHALVAVGAIPNSEDLGLDVVGVRTTASGAIEVDRVSRTSELGIYAAGDVTGVNLLASVAAMQGRIAMWHAFGDAVTPLNWPKFRRLSSPILKSHRWVFHRQTLSQGQFPDESTLNRWRVTHERRCRARAMASSSWW